MSDVEPVAPIYVSSRNAEHVIGQTWRWVRDFARARGVAIHRASGKSFVLASTLQRAIEAEQPAVTAGPEPGSQDELRVMRERLAGAA